MNKILLLLLALMTTEVTHAQYAYFATRGKINYEKVTYTRARMRDIQQKSSTNSSNRMGMGRNFNLENIPESNTELYILDFDEKSTLMYNDPNNQSNNTLGNNRQGGSTRTISTQRGNRGTQQSMNTLRPPNNSKPNNSAKILMQNLKSMTAELQIEIDEKYLIIDSLHQITWRFSDEYRNIAGYECRRVNGATKDSLYLIAFYTEEIPVSGGPALVHGLPGMILGLVIPELHIQYWATKVEYSTDFIQNNWKDKKAKTITFDNFVSSFGRFFQRGRDNSTNKRQVQESLLY